MASICQQDISILRNFWLNNSQELWVDLDFLLSNLIMKCIAHLSLNPFLPISWGITSKFLSLMKFTYLDFISSVVLALTFFQV